MIEAHPYSVPSTPPHRRRTVLRFVSCCLLGACGLAAQAGAANWIQQGKLKASDGSSDASSGSELGLSVALSGDTALVGAPRATVGDSVDHGAAYVFTRGDGFWSEQAKLIASDGVGGSFSDQFGRAVALWGDTALVGAPTADIDENPDQGAVYVFTRSGGVWSEQAKLTAADGVPGDHFGAAIAFSEDGQTILVGAESVSGGGANPGQAYVYVRAGEVWVEQAKLTASEGVPGDNFGSSVALSGDTAAVGAPSADPGGDVGRGAAYVFTREGETWSQQTRLLAPDGGEFETFGWSVAVAGDTALVGARNADPDGVFDQGAAYVFTRSEAAWSEQAKLTASDGGTSDWFGASVALAGDVALVGASRADPDGNANQGAGYVFTRDGETWSEQTRLTAIDGVAGDQFGVSVALEEETVVVGAWEAEVEGDVGQGAAYVFLDFDMPPDYATIQGTVRSLGHCGTAVAPLAGVTVEISGAETTLPPQETLENGFYWVFLPESESPLTISVSAPGHLPAMVEGIAFGGGDLVVQDFDLILDAPCATVEPNELAIALPPEQTTTEAVTLGNVDGAMDLEWTVATAAPPAVRRGDVGAAAPARIGTPGSDTAAARDLASVLGEPLPSLRPIQSAGGVVDCESEPGLIAHDDGTVESGYSGNPANVGEVIFVDRFMPSVHPASFRAVCLAWVGEGGATSLDFEIVIFDDDGPQGSPGTELGALAVTANDIPQWPVSTPTWVSYDISSLGIVIDSGSVYIGARWEPHIPDVFLTADESTGKPPGFAGGFWWNDFADEWREIELSFEAYRSMFVRAVEVAEVDCDEPSTIPWLHVTPTSGSTPTGLTSEVQVSLDTTGLSPGIYEAGVCIATNDPAAPMLLIPIDLTVTGPEVVELAFDPSSLDFGDVEVGSTSAPQTVTLHNAGDADATGLSFVAPGGGFDANAGGCDDTLPAGASCQVVVTFTPTEPGPAEAALQVSSAEGASATLSLVGNGVGEGELTAIGLAVDPEVLASDGNGVFEPDEQVEVAPAWRNDGAAAVSLTGTASGFDGPEGAIYTLADDHADYGLVGPEDTASCEATGVCYRMEVEAPPVRPATHWEATFDETLSEDTTKTWRLHIGDSFADVPQAGLFYPAIETLVHHGVTGGCGGGEYCPAGSNSRGQMAVFLLRAAEGAEYTPPACTEEEQRFPDVPFDSTFCPWIEELATRDVTSGCGGGNYCPGAAVTRGQMAVFLLKAFEGGDYVPPPCAGEFSDVPCTSPFGVWIEELAARGITGGCAAEPPAYCPTEAVSRAQMAVFVTETFGLTLYGP